MSVLVEGNMDFQKWYWDNYDDVSSIVSDEIHTEYLHYKCKQHNLMMNNLKTAIILLEYVAVVEGVNILLLKLLIRFVLI